MVTESMRTARLKAILRALLARTGSVMLLLVTVSQQQQLAASDTALFSTEDNPVAGTFIDFSAADLCFVAAQTNEYLDKGAAYDPYAIHSGIFQEFGVSLAKVRQTLAFICRIQREDELNRADSRLTNQDFLNRHFDFYRWKPDLSQVIRYADQKPLLSGIPSDQILVTRYYVKLANAALTASQTMPHALYAIPFDESGLTLAQADARKSTLTRYRYTKQQVLSGVLEQQGLANPLIYLSRSDLEDTLMQGTVKADLASGASRFYNVHRNNGHEYNRLIAREDQQRYWYFKQVAGVMGYGKDADYKIRIEPLVTVAGDLQLLGLGKLILLSHANNHRLTVLADTGGAFENNGYQLDYLAGFYTGWTDYAQSWKGTPDYYQVRILVFKDQH